LLSQLVNRLDGIRNDYSGSVSACVSHTASLVAAMLPQKTPAGEVVALATCRKNPARSRASGNSPQSIEPVVRQRIDGIVQHVALCSSAGQICGLRQ
jgi:hypothetical protein